jgi:hypothetical protein
MCRYGRVFGYVYQAHMMDSSWLAETRDVSLGWKVSSCKRRNHPLEVVSAAGSYR